MGNDEGDAISRYTLLVLLQAQQDRASELCVRSADFGPPIEYKVEGRWYNFSPPPRDIIPKVLAEFANLAGLQNQEFPAEGNIDIPFSGVHLRWKVRLSVAGANCFPILP